MSAIRVLHCPLGVAGNPQGLARAERELGLESWSIVLRASPFANNCDEILCTEEENPFIVEMKRWSLLLRALKDFDIIHFNFGQSILPHWVPFEGTVYTIYLSPLARGILSKFYIPYATLLELNDLPILKFAGKGIVVTYQGGDCRQGDFCLKNFEISPATEVEPGYYSANSDERKRRRIAKFAQYADRIYAVNPDLLHVVPDNAEFLPYSHIDIRDWNPLPREVKNERPIIVHAPTHRKVKGTRYIFDAVSRLKEEGVDYEFLLYRGSLA